MSEETEPRQVRVEEPVGISSSVSEFGNQDFVSLDVLLPSNSSSAEKKLLFSLSSTVFSARRRVRNAHDSRRE